MYVDVHTYICMYVYCERGPDGITSTRSNSNKIHGAVKGERDPAPNKVLGC